MRRWLKATPSTAFSPCKLPMSEACYRRRQDGPGSDYRHVGFKRRPALRNALFTDRGVNEFLIVNMLAYNGRELDYNRMPIPFRCVATDLNTLQPLTFSAGPMPQAVRASISIPGSSPPSRTPTDTSSSRRYPRQSAHGCCGAIFTLRR